MNHDMTQQMSRTRADLKRLVHDAEDALRQTADQTGENAKEWRLRMQGSVAEARANLAALPREGLERMRTAGVAADGYVHAHPWTVIAAAAGVSALIGMLITRR
jgi:ElaB/YqjD/DUF883 family membrane-anchored ribosome-binding protein